MNEPNLVMQGGRAPYLRVPMREVFAAQIAEARTLGFQLRIAPLDGMVGARLDPITDRARDALNANSLGDQDAAPVAGLEAIRHYDDPAHTLDATREAVDACLDLARTVTA